MLHITGSVKHLKDEVMVARGIISDIIGVLSNVTEKTNLTKTVGVFAVQLPEFKILTKDADSAKRILRMVCTGEMSPHEASKKFTCAFNELTSIYNILCNLS